MIGYRKRLVLACFADNSVFRIHVLDISCCDNRLYNLYEGTNVGDNSDVPDKELQNIIMRHFLRYLETNKWYKHQEYIAIAK